jgi:hypothetical protein
MRIRRTVTLAGLVLAAMSFVTACGGDSAEMTTTAAAAATTAAPQVSQAAPGDGENADALGTGGVEGSVLPTTDLGRDIIYTADLTVAVDDVAAAGAEATRIIEDIGGYLFGQETTALPEPHSVLTFKVAPEKFEEALTRLGSVGEVRTQNISADDVTERVVDLQSRIATAETSVERLRGFLEKAEDVETVAALENQLLQRETDLETMRGQLRTLQNQVDLATITLTLTGALSNPSIDLVVTGFPGHDGGVSCPGDGQIRVSEKEAATVCFEITNAGDTPLAGITLQDTVLEVGLEDLTVVWGNPHDVLQPGQSIVLAREITVERNLRTQTRVSAEPVDQEGNRVEGREVAVTQSMNVAALDAGGLPGFRDGLEASWHALVWVGGVIVLFVGAILPLVIPLALLAVLWIWVSRRRPQRKQAAGPTPPWTGTPEEPEGPEAPVPAAPQPEPGSTEE